MQRTKSLWLRWVAANALGELFGLGLTLLVGTLYFTQFADEQSVAGVLAAFAVAVLSGVIEASVVGLAQWRAMQPWFPSVTLRGWWLGTLGGALAAYVLGYLPSTLISLSQQAEPSAAPVSEPPQWLTLLLAAGLGLAGGAVLSFAQWLELRGKVRRAGLWVPANMLAWAAGMPLIFLGIDIAYKLYPPVWAAVLVMAGVLLLAGAVVGAIHGAFLVRMAQAG